MGHGKVPMLGSFVLCLSFILMQLQDGVDSGAATGSVCAYPWNERFN